MSKSSSLLFATVLSLMASISMFGMPATAATAPDISFSVFFDPGLATLSKEEEEIVSVAAQRFAGVHGQHSAARISVISQTDGQGNASLSIERAKAVGDQLVHDGVQRNFVSVEEQPSKHAEPVRLLESLDQRVSIGIQENSVIGGL